MLAVRWIHDDFVKVNRGKGYLYGLELFSGTEKVESAVSKVSEVAAMVSRARGNGRHDNLLVLAVKKSRLKNFPAEETPFRTEVFMFTPSDVLWQECASVFGYRKLKGYEVANALFRCQTLTDEVYFRNRSIEYDNVPVFAPDRYLEPPPGSAYTYYVKNEIQKKKERGRFPFSVIKACAVYPTKPDLKMLFSSDWEGVLWLRFSLNDISPIIKSRAVSSASDREKRFWKEYHEAYVEGEVQAVLVEPTLITDVSIDYIALFSKLGFSAVEWFAGRDRYVFGTPIFEGDTDLEWVVPAERMAELTPLSFAKNYYVSDVDAVYGVSKTKECVIYSAFEEAQSPHKLFCAPTRSGKSFLTQKLVTQVAEIDVEKLWNGDVPENPRLPVVIRYFDVGFSAEFLVRLMKARGYSVEILSPYPDIKINPFEIDDEEDLDLAVSLVNLTLNAIKEKPLGGREETALRSILRLILDRYDDVAVWLDENIEDTLMDNYPEYYKKAKEHGAVTIADACRIKGLEHLKYPRTIDVIRIAKSVKMKLADSQKEEKEALDGLIGKLKLIADLENFRYWSSFTVKDVEFLYFDLAYVKSHSLFVPIYAGIFNKVLKGLRQMKISVHKFVIADEFHNVSEVPTFAKAYEKLIREAAKFNIHLWLITQEPTDFPKAVANNVGTKVILRPASDVSGESTTASFIKTVREHFGIEIPEEAFDLPRYTPLFIYPGGYFTLRAPLKKIEYTVFESRKVTTIETPDGIKITKTYVEEE